MSRYQLKLLLQRMMLLLGAYFVFRVAFLISNWPVFERENTSEILQAFASGVRFDISAIFLTNSIFIFLSFLPYHWLNSKRVQNALFTIFILVNAFALLLNVADVEFYKFSGKKLSFEILGIKQDVGNQAGSLFVTYWKHTLSLLLGGLSLWKFYPKWDFQRSEKGFSPVLSGLFFLVLAGLWLVGARGGTQIKPLAPIDAYAQGSQHLGSLSLNSTFSLIRSKIEAAVKRVHYFSSWEEVKNHLELPKRFRTSFHGRFKGKNVVVIILESFSTEYFGAFNNEPRYTPFLDSLIEKSLAFQYNFANGRRSIEAVPSILAGVPSLMEEPFITSNFQTNKILGLAELLKQAGYATYFFHGAQNGSMHFDSFALRLGFQKFYGLNEFPDTRMSDGQWGVLDEPFLQFMIKELSQMKQPFGATVFTLSSHHPYLIPDHLKGKFPKGTLPIHESIGYVDYSLKKFFETAEQQPWYKDTLFVITADHISTIEDKKYLNILGLFRVPLIFFAPGENWEGIPRQRITQHVDVLPTLVDLMDLDASRLNIFGQSIFGNLEDAVAFNRLGFGYWIMNQKNYLEVNTIDETGKCSLKNDTFDLQLIKKAAWEELKKDPDCGPLLVKILAYSQYFNLGLLDNKWYSAER